MIRHRLSTYQWKFIRKNFPKPKATGRPPSNPRTAMDGILWILRTGSPWRDLPEALGPWGTVWDLFEKWNEDGKLQAILDRLRGQVKIDKKLWCIDGTIVRAAKCASGGGKKTIPKSRKTTRSAAVAAV